MAALAWHIDHIVLRNFRSFASISLGLEQDLTVLIGRNSEGKTSILDALAIGLGSVLAGFGQPAPGFQPHDAHAIALNADSREAIGTIEQFYPVSISVAATIDGSPWNWTRERRSRQGKTTWGDNGVRTAVQKLAEKSTTSATEDVALPIIAYFGVERLVGVRKDRTSISTSRLGAYEAALDRKSDLTRLSNYLEGLYQRAAIDVARQREISSPVRSQLDAIELACERALSEFGWEKPQWDPILGCITLRSRQSGDSLPLAWLSSGVRITAGLVIDLASRMGRANPHLGGMALAEETPGIVLIDEVDLHLHPQWQQRILTSLRAAFPSLQFIVTTHSPQVLSTVPARCIKILSDCKSSTPEFSEGLRPDIILEALQETTPEPPTENRKNLEEYLQLVHADEGLSDRAKRLRSKLDSEMGGVTFVPELAEADAYTALFGED